MADWDWERKSKLIQLILGTKSPTAMAKKIFTSDRADAQEKFEWQRFCDVERKWRGEQPSAPKEDSIRLYFAKISVAVGLKEEVGIDVIANGSFNEFYNIIPSDKLRNIPDRELNKLKQNDSNKKTGDRAHFEQREWHVILSDPSHKSPSFMEYVHEHGIIEQKHCYLAPESVYNWRKLVEYEGYPNYTNCLHSLRRFLSHDYWKTSISKRRLGAVIMLGAGCAEKSNAIVIAAVLSNHYSQQRRLHFGLVDFSPYMMEDDVSYITAGSHFSKINQTIELRSYKFDFLKAKRLKRIAHKDSHDGVTGFFILGCTIGNLDERALLMSVSEAARPGDFLVVGTEFIEGNTVDYKNTLLTHYDNDQMRDTTVEPVRHILDRIGVAMNRDSRRKLVSIEVDDSGKGMLIDGTIAVRSRLTLDKHQDDYPKLASDELSQLEGLILMMSKRYIMEKFIAFVERFGFRHVANFEADYKAYKQVVFERI